MALEGAQAPQARQGKMAKQGAHHDRRQGLRVLLVGHACAPDVGSEPGLTWNWARHLAEHHEVCVVAHPHWRVERPN
jgi:hypothetical protein